MIDRISLWIVRNRVFISIASLGILLLSLVGMGALQVNFDFNDYLPADLPSVRGMQILNDEFSGSETVFVIVPVTSRVEVEQINRRIEEMPGVAGTTWYSDLANVYVPENFVDDNITEMYLKGEETIIQVELSTNGHDAAYQAEQINDVAGEDARVTGAFVYEQEMKRMGEDAKTLMLIMALVISLIVLGIAITQPAYSVLFLLVAGISIIVNFGLTYFLRGEMSFLSSSVAAAMQIAVTLDYAVFLLHRYEEEKKHFASHAKAMQSAISKTSVSIFSSGLTTAVGFLALMFMSFKLIGDMGLVMAQGVGIGFILTLTLLPALILFLEKPLSKLKHRQWIPDLSGVGRFVMGNRTVIVVIFAVIMVVSIFGHFNLNVTYDMTEGLELNKQTQADIDSVQQIFGSGKEATVIITSETVSQRLRIENDLTQIDGIESVTGPLSMKTAYLPNSFIPRKVTDQFNSGDRSMLMVVLETDTKENEYAAFERLQEYENNYDGDLIITGQDILAYDMARVSEPDLNRVTIVSVIAILLILLLTLRKGWQALAIVLAIETAIWMNIAYLFYTNVTNTFFSSLVALSAIQLGATVDYCILLTTRFNEEKKKPGVSITEAMVQAVKGAGPAIITAACTLFGATLAISIISQINIVSGMTALFSRGALISMTVVLLVLPALLVLVEKIKIGGRRKDA